MTLFIIHAATVLSTILLVWLSYQYTYQTKRTHSDKRKHRLSLAGMAALYPVSFASIWIDMQWSVHDMALGAHNIQSDAIEAMVIANKSVKMAFIFSVCSWLAGSVILMRRRSGGREADAGFRRMTEDRA